MSKHKYSATFWIARDDPEFEGMHEGIGSFELYDVPLENIERMVKQLIKNAKHLYEPALPQATTKREEK